jgi:hypothetical protein
MSFRELSTHQCHEQAPCLPILLEIRPSAHHVSAPIMQAIIHSIIDIAIATPMKLSWIFFEFPFMV